MPDQAPERRKGSLKPQLPAQIVTRQGSTHSSGEQYHPTLPTKLSLDLAHPTAIHPMLWRKHREITHEPRIIFMPMATVLPKMLAPLYSSGPDVLPATLGWASCILLFIMDTCSLLLENFGVILLTPWLTGFTFLNTGQLLPFSFLESLFVLTNHKLIRTRVMAPGKV